MPGKIEHVNFIIPSDDVWYAITSANSLRNKVIITNQGLSNDMTSDCNIIVRFEKTEPTDSTGLILQLGDSITLNVTSEYNIYVQSPTPNASVEIIESESNEIL